MTTATENGAKPDYDAIKSKQNAAWSSGDYAKIGVTLQIVGEQLAETMDLAPDARVLDVAAGNGHATLAFARRWSKVTSTDYVGALLERGRLRAEAEGLGDRQDAVGRRARQGADDGRLVGRALDLDLVQAGEPRLHRA